MFGSFAKMMKAVTEMRRRMPEVRQKLAASEFAAESPGGAVRATVNGKLALVRLQIDRQRLPDGELDTEMLADLVRAAVSAAQAQAVEAVRQAMRELTGGVDVPGLDGML